MDVQIDKDELERVRQQQLERQKEQEALTGSILSADFIEFDAEVPGLGAEQERSTVAKTDRMVCSLAASTSSPSARHAGEKPAPVNSVLRFNVPWMMRKKHSSYSSMPTERLHQELVDFADYVSPTEEESFARSEAIKRLTDVVMGIWSDASVQIFGSFDSQLYLPHSDLDVVIICESVHLDSLKKPPLPKLARALLKAKIPIPESVRVITKARVPIIKYVDAQTDFEVDVSFNTTSGIDAAKFMRQEMRAQPAVRPLTLALKHFLRMRALNEVFYGGLGSYTVMCLVISFLQTHPLVQSGMIKAHENLGVLLMELFELYGRNHNSEVVGIEVEAGGGYFDKYDYGWRQESKPHLLSIKDPYDSNNDVSKGSFAYGAARQAFEHAFNILKCAMLEFESYQRAGETRQKSSHVPSILGSIITLEPKLLRHRYYIQQTANL